LKIGSFEFNLREMAGATGDFGVLFPLAVGYFAVCGLNPAGLLVMMGIANILTGLVYRLPLPIEPMKVLAVVAIAQQWSPSMVYASAFAMGVVWFVFALTGVMGWIAQITPHAVIRGIQVALGLMLAMQAIRMLSTWWLAGLIAVGIILGLRRNPYAPGAIVVILAGIALMHFQGELRGIEVLGFRWPEITMFSLHEVWTVMLLAGFAQIPLTATNAVISTSSLISTYWPDRYVGEKQLSLNMGIMNLIAPFFGGMPMCHGAGGLAGQYYFGARTGGTNIIEGTLWIILGLFFATSIATIFATFPMAIIGAMMLLVGLEMIKFVRDVKPGRQWVPLAATVLVSLFANMAYGFLAGLLVYYLFCKQRGENSPEHLEPGDTKKQPTNYGKGC